MEQESLTIKGVTISGDFERINTIRVVCGSLILKLSNGKYFFVNRVHQFDDIEFDVQKDELIHRAFFESKITKYYSTSRLGILKSKALHNLPCIALLGAGIPFVVSGCEVNSKVLVGIGALSLTSAFAGKIFEIAKEKINERTNKFYFGEREDDKNLKGFMLSKDNKVQTLLRRENGDFLK